MVTKKSGSKSKAESAAELLLARIAELEKRIARLEAARDAAVSSLVAAPPVPAHAAPPLTPAVEPAPHAPEPTPREEVSEETLLVIAASVAAFLGERAHVRQVRLVSSEAWAQQGRVSVMASHRWAVHR
jgi:methylmalonyl-CoA carboxyltransferase 12S subunit